VYGVGVWCSELGRSVMKGKTGKRKKTRLTQTFGTEKFLHVFRLFLLLMNQHINKMTSELLNLFYFGKAHLQSNGSAFSARENPFRTKI
jgi:hypothetical protein